MKSVFAYLSFLFSLLLFVVSCGLYKSDGKKSLEENGPKPTKVAATASSETSCERVSAAEVSSQYWQYFDSADVRTSKNEYVPVSFFWSFQENLAEASTKDLGVLLSFAEMQLYFNCHISQSIFELPPEAARMSLQKLSTETLLSFLTHN